MFHTVRRGFFVLLLCLVITSPTIAQAEILELPIDFSPGMPPLERFEDGKLTYEDPSISLVRDTVHSTEFSCDYYVIHVKIANPTQLRTISASDDGEFNTHAKAPVAYMARRTKAVLAINGDYFDQHPGSFVLRQGILYRGTVNPNRDILLIDEEGDLHIVLAEEDPAGMDLTQYEGKKVINGFEFGPALIKDGERVLSYDKSPKNSEPADRAQRIAICQTGKLEYMLVSCTHWGLSLSDFCDLILTLDDHVQNAYTLDGGNSAQMVFLNVKINNTQNQDPRLVPDCIYFASAYSPD